MPHSLPLISTLVGSLVMAFIFGMLAHRLKLSNLVGYLFAGVLIGPFTPGFVANQALAAELAELGVILLMFGVGLHFSVKDLMSVKWIAIPGAILQIVFATILGALIGKCFGWTWEAGLVFGLSLSTASTVVLLRTLESKGLLTQKEGQIAIGWLIVEDLVMVLALVLLPIMGHTEAENSNLNLFHEIAATLGKVFAFIAFMFLIGKRAIPWILTKTAQTQSGELFTLSVLVIALGIAFGAVKLFGVSFALGAFFAGVVLSGSELSHKAAHDTLPLRDAFAVLFFVAVGMLFDPDILLQHPVKVLLTVLIIIAGKSLAAYALVRFFRYPHSIALTISASLAQIGEFSFILAGIAIYLNLFPSTARDLILAGAIISIMLNPFIFNWIGKIQEEKFPIENTDK